MSLNNSIDKLMPREKALIQGIDKLSDIELLSIILRTGSHEKNVLLLANSIIDSVGCLSKLNTLTYDDLVLFKGIGKVKAIEMLAVIQISIRMNEIGVMNYEYAKNPEVIFSLYKKQFEQIQQEHFIVLSLNSKNAIVDEHIAFIGTLSQSLVHPRDIFKRIIEQSASSFIVLHNHPSGDPTPSKSDIETTKRLANLAELFSIPLLDHIIIGKNKYFSFKENNFL